MREEGPFMLHGCLLKELHRYLFAVKEAGQASEMKRIAGFPI